MYNGFRIFAKMCNHHYNLRANSSPQKAMPQPSATFPSSPPPHALSKHIYFLRLDICLFWTCHMNSITYYVTLCAWHLSLKHDFSRFTPAVACVSTLPLHCYVIFHFTYTPHFLFPGSADADVSFLPVAATDNAAVSTHAGFPSLLGNN